MAGSFGRAANRIFDLIVLSILQMLLYIPIVTIGGSKTAMYLICRRWSEGEDATIPDFLRSFKKEWKKAIPLSLITVGVATFAVVDLIIFKQAGCPALLRVLILAVVLFSGAVIEHCYMVNAIFMATTGQIVKDALIIALMHAFRSLLTAVIIALVAIPALKTHLIFLVNQKPYEKLRDSFSNQ